MILLMYLFYCFGFDGQLLQKQQQHFIVRLLFIHSMRKELVIHLHGKTQNRSYVCYNVYHSFIISNYSMKESICFDV